MDVHVRELSFFRAAPGKPSLASRVRRRAGGVCAPRHEWLVAAATTVKKSIMVLCTSGVAVGQWAAQFTLWTTVDEDAIYVFTSDNKEPLPPLDEVRNARG